MLVDLDDYLGKLDDVANGDMINDAQRDLGNSMNHGKIRMKRPLSLIMGESGMINNIDI